MACNAAACLVLSLISQRREATARRQSFHDFLETHSALPSGLDYLRPLAWAVTLLWLFFAVGPGAVYGNWAFGGSSGGMEAWLVGIPPLWAWQMLWWSLGVVMIWFLADRLGLSKQLSRRFEPLPRSQRPGSDIAALSAGGAQQGLWIALGLGALAVFANWLFG
jgi:SSS family solute:Na+ symporter